MATKVPIITYHGSNYRAGKKEINIKFLDGVIASDESEWVDMALVESCKFQFDGITTGTVQVRGWNGATPPAQAENGTQISSDVTSDGTPTGLELEGKQIPRFMKVKVTVSTTIDLDVDARCIGYRKL